MTCLSILTLPISGGNPSKTTTQKVPVLFHLDLQGKTAYWELATYLFWALYSRIFSARKARNVTLAFLRFIELHGAALSQTATSPLSLSHALSLYCFARVSGASALPELDLEKNRWSPIAVRSAATEFDELVAFMEFSQSRYGHVRIGTHQLIFRKATYVGKAFKAPTRDFLVHVNTQREIWQKFISRGHPELPKVLRKPSQKPSSREQKSIRTEELLTIINHEPNPVFKSVFIILGFGGLRLSEPLHFWQTDILPPSYWGQIGGKECSNPLLLRCHPSESTYLGSFGHTKLNRASFLANRYNALPRHKLSNLDPMYSGWKGTKFLHKQMFTPTFLLAPPHVSKQLNECFSEIRSFHQVNQTSECHPYFFCNMHTTHDAYFGQPLKISNLQRAWNLAVKRVALEPHRENRNLHALRHRYICTARNMGLDNFTIQDIVGHSNIESQREYGTEISQIQDLIPRLQMGGGGVKIND
ncbi:tyrosine-type recombinase/integrase [Kordiimonas sp.]|uniref:tyrosine-type recombinase/integrase n=1 Tax=Kordiimonas sp. TaxID=1970157 RepID=UPI003A959835